MLQRLQEVAKVQNKAKDSAYASTRTPFSRFGDNDLQKWQKLQKCRKLQGWQEAEAAKGAKAA